MDQPKHVYDESSIEEYEGVDAVRKRTTMYLEQLGRRGVFRCVQEIAGNSLDEARAKRATKVSFYFDETTGIIQIDDDGAGIPIGKLVDCATVLHAGGKFNSDAYDYSIGQNGVGLTCTNATSDMCKIVVERDGKRGVVEFSEGKVVKPLTITDAPKDKHGTSVTFHPDIKIFGDIGIDVDMYYDYCEKLSYNNKGVKIEFYGKKASGKEVGGTFLSQNGIIDYLTRKVLPWHKPIIKDVVQVPFTEDIHEYVFIAGGEKMHKKMALEMVFTWVADSKDQIVTSFVNGIQTSDGGFHVTGVRKGLADIIRAGLKNVLTKKDPPYEKFSMDDLFEGWTGVIAAFCQNPQFDGQTKNHFTSQEYEDFAQKVARDYFGEWTRLNPSKFRAILNQIILSAKARLAAQKARNAVKNLSPASNAVLMGISRYDPCKSRNVNETELFIVEGDSAGGSAKSGRNMDFQAIYRMMGKPLNVYGNKHLDDVMKRDGINTIGDLMKIIGRGESRFSKYIIMSDADADGGHITSLLLGFFYTFRPELIRDGYVYAANPPLFMFKFNKGKNRVSYIPTIDVYNRVVEDTIMKEFDLGCYNKKGQVYIIKNQDFYHQFLINLRDYANIIQVAANQAVVNPSFLEAFVIYCDDILSHKKIRLNGWDLEVYKDKDLGCTVIEGIYEYVFHKVEITPFFLAQCQKIVEKLKLIHWSNLLLIHKKTGKRLGPGMYKISSSIDQVISKSANITRFKGLGEMEAEQLWDTTMNPETRTLTKITLDEAKQAAGEYKEWLDKLLGNDIAGRKEYYRQYL